MIKIFCYLLHLLIVITFASFDSHAANQKTIKLGMSTALSGPNQYLGRSVYEGMSKKFNEINKKGGIKGKKIELIALDDGYQPQNALQNTRTLINKHKVIAIVGNVGTPTAKESAPQANKNGIVFYGAYTGANILRQTPPQPYIFNYRASYEQEMQVIVDHILQQDISPYEIAFFLQDDKYGQAGYEAASTALKNAGFKHIQQLPKTYYQRNSLSINNAIESLIKIKPRPKAVVIVGSYKASAKLIGFLHKFFYETKFYNLSFAGAPALAESIPDIQSNVYITQVVPPISKKLTTKYDQDVIKLEGYLAATILVDTLKAIKGNITSKALRKALESKGNFSIEIQKNMSFSKLDHQASDRVWLAELGKNKKWKIVK